ncbi:MAG: DUF481 domain-containing protein [Elusimicrobiota bacterium]
MKKIFFMIPLSFLCLYASAQNKVWKDSAELSYVKTSGNSKTETISAKNTFNYEWQKAILDLSAGGLGTKNDKDVTAEQFYASKKVSLKLFGKNYAFEKVSWDKNRFSGIKDRWDFSLGLGRNIVDKEKDKLSLEAGGGYIFEDRVYPEENKSFGTYRGYLKYWRKLSETASFGQDFEYLGNLKDSSGYRMNAETSLITSINSHFSLKASYVWKYLNSPVSGFKKTDTLTGISLIVNY